MTRLAPLLAGLAVLSGCISANIRDVQLHHDDQEVLVCGEVTYGVDPVRGAERVTTTMVAGLVDLASGVGAPEQMRIPMSFVREDPTSGVHFYEGRKSFSNPGGCVSELRGEMTVSLDAGELGTLSDRATIREEVRSKLVRLGPDEVDGYGPFVITVRLACPLSEPVTVDLTFRPSPILAGADPRISPSRLELGPGETFKEAEVTFSGSPPVGEAFSISHLEAVLSAGERRIGEFCSGICFNSGEHPSTSCACFQRARGCGAEAVEDCSRELRCGPDSG